MDVRIIAHYMHSTERDAAVAALRDTDITDAYVIGTIADEQIPALEAQGLIIQNLGAPPETSGPAVLSGDGYESDTPPEGYCLLTLAGPLLPEWQQSLAALGVVLLERMPSGAYSVYLTATQLAQLRGLPFVTGVRAYGVDDTNPTGASARPPVLGAPQPESATGGNERSDVLLHRAEDMPAVRRWLRARKIKVLAASTRKLRLRLAHDSALALELAALPEIARLDPYVPPTLHNDLARGLLGIDGGNPGQGVKQTGAGQIVAVADTGLDETHPDFAGRIVGVKALGRKNDPSDPHGHGTHVAGSVLGDGAASTGAVRGAAPDARLFFQSLLDRRGGLGGLPLELGDLFQEAYDAGARIHNNSWGANTKSMYTINASEVDGFVAARRDMLIVISAGNDGSATTPLHSLVGFVDWLSIGSPASCKNALTVGASRSSRTSGGFSTRTYGQIWPRDYPDPPINAERVSGNPESLAAFSSRGPCDDRRIKPDVVAPGTDILSARSAKAKRASFWGEHAPNKRYAYMGGTSMAAPLVAGCAALVREYLVSERGHEPSAALLKAVLVNGTRWLTGTDALADHPFCPNYHQGFGAIFVPGAIPSEHAPELRLEFIDLWREPATRQLRASGDVRRYAVTARASSELRLCMAYTDIPGRALQNDLNLFVQHIPSGRKWVGNGHIRSDLRGPDRDNNIEIVRIENAPAGEYLVQVAASNILRGPQDFALVLTGALETGLVPRS